MEQMIKGDTQPNAKDGFPGLRSPKWPDDILPPIDQKLADKGAELYKTHCQECHRPPVSSAAFWDFNNKDWWTKNEAGEPILKVENIPISHIGTDPAQAADMLNRTVARPRKSRHQQAAASPIALGERGREDRQLRLRPEEAAGESRRSGSGSTAICRTSFAASLPTRFVRSTASGRRRPICTTARCRPSTHCLEIRKRRPTDILSRQPRIRSRKARLQDRPIADGFEFDTSIRGNSNRGHEFRKDFEQEQGNQGRHRTGAVGGRSEGADRIPQDAVGIFRDKRSRAPPRACQARVTAGTGSCRRN